MGRRLHAGAAILLLSLTGPGRAAAQAAGEDSGWFDPAPAPATESPPSPAPATPVSVPASVPPAPARPAPEADDADPRALTDFRPHLDPHGTWVQDARYGTVWVPYEGSVGQGFAPYVSGGHWELSSNGEWVWASDYPFGWIVFHYGRWVWISGHGWAWVPGYRYAPAWVAWRVPSGGDAYVGWAPAGPDFIWVDGRAVVVYYPSPYYWVFCPSPYAFHAHVRSYIVRDRALMQRLAYSTRHYTPAEPRSRTRTPASPTPSAARVPPSALPRQRPELHPALPRTVAAPVTNTRSSRATRERQAASPAPVPRERVPAPTPPSSRERTSAVPRATRSSTLRPVFPAPLLDSAKMRKRR